MKISKNNENLKKRKNNLQEEISQNITLEVINKQNFFLYIKAPLIATFILGVLFLLFYFEIILQICLHKNVEILKEVWILDSIGNSGTVHYKRIEGILNAKDLQNIIFEFFRNKYPRLIHKQDPLIYMFFITIIVMGGSFVYVFIALKYFEIPINVDDKVLFIGGILQKKITDIFSKDNFTKILESFTESLNRFNNSVMRIIKDLENLKHSLNDFIQNDLQDYLQPIINNKELFIIFLVIYLVIKLVLEEDPTTWAKENLTISLIFIILGISKFLHKEVTIGNIINDTGMILGIILSTSLWLVTHFLNFIAVIIKIMVFLYKVILKLPSLTWVDLELHLGIILLLMVSLTIVFIILNTYLVYRFYNRK